MKWAELANRTGEERNTKSQEMDPHGEEASPPKLCATYKDSRSRPTEASQCHSEAHLALWTQGPHTGFVSRGLITSIYYQSVCIRWQTRAEAQGPFCPSISATCRGRSALENLAYDPQVSSVSTPLFRGISILKFVIKAFHPLIHLKSLTISSAHCCTDLASELLILVRNFNIPWLPIITVT